MLYELLIAPFLEFEFMRRALVGTFALSFGAAPIGVFLMLRRMSLIGDAMAHAILPGAAIGFMLAGLNLFAMAGGGLIAGFVIAVGAGLIARATELKEDASLAAFFLISLALGVTIVSLKGTNVDLLHFLFGSVLAVDDPTLLLIVSISSVSTILLALIWRPLVLECVDPGFLRSVSRAGGPTHIAFLLLVVMNLVGGFPGARNAARGRHHDAAGGDLPLLGARHQPDDRHRHRLCRDIGLCRPAAFLPCQPAVRPCGDPRRRRHLCVVGCFRTDRRIGLAAGADASS